MKQQPVSYKTFLLNYLIFILIIASVFMLLVYMIKFSQKNWNKRLEPAVLSVLEELEPETWIIEAASPIDNPLTTAAACYDVRNKKNGEYYKVVILRLQTFYGPVPGVFLMDKDKKVEYKGYALIQGRIKKHLNNFSQSRRINYWKKRIPEIIK